MARTRSIFNNPLRGNLGNQTFKNYSGTQVVTSRIYETKTKGDGATLDQRISRLLMPNITLCASEIKQYLPVLFEENRYNKNAYTHFLSHNMGKVFPVLPKDMIERKLCYWGAYQVSCGSLPSIRVDYNDTYLKVALYVHHDALGNARSVADLSKDLIELNSGWEEGDYFVVIRLRYMETPSSVEVANGYTQSYFSWLKVDTKNTELVRNAWHGSKFALRDISATSTTWQIAFNDQDQDAVAVVQVRRKGSKFLSSTSVLVGSDYFNDCCERYSSDPYLTECAATWGYKEESLQ